MIDLNRFMSKIDRNRDRWLTRLKSLEYELSLIDDRIWNPNSIWRRRFDLQSLIALAYYDCTVNVCKINWYGFQTTKKLFSFQTSSVKNYPKILELAIFGHFSVIGQAAGI